MFPREKIYIYWFQTCIQCWVFSEISNFVLVIECKISGFIFLSFIWIYIVTVVSNEKLVLIENFYWVKYFFKTHYWIIWPLNIFSCSITSCKYILDIIIIRILLFNIKNKISVFSLLFAKLMLIALSWGDRFTLRGNAINFKKK